MTESVASRARLSGLPREPMLDRPPASSSGLRVAFDPGDVQSGLGKLVLTVVELIRQLLERQAIHRMEAGSLTEEEVERLGLTFLQLSEQIARLREQFRLLEEDLNLDLGPLGKLL
ncbi:gas vesicle protein K [Aquisphaera insulae]|uniref:gas vesicle protein K n=1 Tax=Aquisphaera insulae TaxID=2712864 RepID=UPI00196A5F74|nr:gas vesicle protein K [Aquisphaera insulae]